MVLPMGVPHSEQKNFMGVYRAFAKKNRERGTFNSMVLLSSAKHLAVPRGDAFSL